MNKTIEELKDGLISLYTDCCMDALKQQGIKVGDGGRFYEKLADLLEEHLIIGDFR